VSIEDAIHEDVLTYPGGVNALAGRYEIAPQTLRNMASNQASHPWSLAKFRKLCLWSTKKLALHELCAENSGMFVPTGRYDGKGLPDLFQLTAQLTAELGDVSREVSEGASDGRISVADYHRISTAMADVFEVGAALRAAAKCAAGPALSGEGGA
jgi:hypothetical protein